MSSWTWLRWSFGVCFLLMHSSHIRQVCWRVRHGGRSLSFLLGHKLARVERYAARRLPFSCFLLCWALPPVDHQRTRKVSYGWHAAEHFDSIAKLLMSMNLIFFLQYISYFFCFVNDTTAVCCCLFQIMWSCDC